MSWIVGGAAVARLGLERPSPAKPIPAPAQTLRKAERVITPLHNLSDASEIAMRRRRSPDSMFYASAFRSLKAERCSGDPGRRVQPRASGDTGYTHFCAATSSATPGRRRTASSSAPRHAGPVVPDRRAGLGRAPRSSANARLNAVAYLFGGSGV